MPLQRLMNLHGKKIIKDLLFVIAIGIGAVYILKLHQDRKYLTKPMEIKQQPKAVKISYTYNRESIEEGDEFKVEFIE